MRLLMSIALTAGVCALAVVIAIGLIGDAVDHPNQPDPAPCWGAP